MPTVGARAHPPGSPQRRGGHVDIRIQLAAVFAALSLAVAPAIAAPQHDALLASHHKHHSHHWKHHHECSTPKCAHHADILWSKHHPPKATTTFSGWAIPAYVVECESHFTNEPPHEYAPGIDPSGYYQIIKSTWKAYGGLRYAPTAWEATLPEQSIIARKIVRESPRGLGEWACA